MISGTIKEILQKLRFNDYRFHFWIVVLLTDLLISCKKGEIGPQGSSYDLNADKYFSEGYIQATASGVRGDGSSYSYNFFYDGNSTPESNHYYPTDDSIHIEVSKFYFGKGDSLESGWISIEFDVPDWEHLSSVRNAEANIHFIKPLGDITHITSLF